MLRRTVLLVALLVPALAASAVARPGAAAGPVPPEIIRSLPAGDVVMVLDAGTLLNTTLPAMLASRPETAQKLNANIAMIQEASGLDLRQVRQVAVTMLPAPNGGQATMLAVADGNFDALAKAGAMDRAAAAYAKANPKVTSKTETYEGTTVYTFPEAVPTARPDTAFALLDSHTLLYGTPGGIRLAVDVRRGKAANATTNAEVMDAFNQSDASGVMRFAARIPQSVMKQWMAESPDDPFAKSLSGIRYMFGSLSVSQQAGLALKSVARTNKAADAASVLATVNALIGLGKMATANKPELAPLMDFVSAASSGTDVTLSVNVPANRLEDVVRAIDKQKGVLAER